MFVFFRIHKLFKIFIELCPTQELQLILGEVIHERRIDSVGCSLIFGLLNSVNIKNDTDDTGRASRMDSNILLPFGSLLNMLTSPSCFTTCISSRPGSKQSAEHIPIVELR